MSPRDFKRANPTTADSSVKRESGPKSIYIPSKSCLILCNSVKLCMIVYLEESNCAKLWIKLLQGLCCNTTTCELANVCKNQMVDLPSSGAISNIFKFGLKFSYKVYFTTW